jgi:hypothetical protein
VIYPLYLTYRPENVKQYNQSLKMLQQQLEERNTSLRPSSTGHSAGSSSASADKQLSTRFKTAPDGTIELYVCVSVV